MKRFSGHVDVQKSCSSQQTSWRFPISQPTCPGWWAWWCALTLTLSHVFREISFSENLGKFASSWRNVKVAFLLGKPWINLKIWGLGAGLLPHIWAYCPLIAP